MKKQHQLRTSIATLLFSAFFSTTVFAQNIDIRRYEQAKLPLSYEGEVGALLQQLAQRLNIGFISYEWDITQKVSIQNQKNVSIKALFSALENNLSNTHIRLEQVGQRLFLVASAKNAEPLMATATKQEPKQFIGDVVFGENDISVNGQNDEIFQKFNALASQITDKNLIEQQKNKKSPKYQVTSKENLGLEHIRVTPLGTFLMFKDGVNTKDFKIRTKVEQVEMYSNLIVISHQKQNAPARIEVRDKSGKSLILQNTVK